MTTTDVEFESEEFLKLLTDALRSGPGSPEWRDALRRLREQGLEHGDEYHLLITAREHLESGKGYRSVSAGPEFTKRLMSELEKETIESSARPQTAMMMAVACAAGMLVVLLTIGYLLWHASDESGGPLLLVNTVAAVDLTGKENPQWKKIGALPVETNRGAMKYVPSPTQAATGGGWVWNTPIPADEPFAAQVTLRVPRPEENLVAQVFVTDDPQFNDENGTTPHELVWLLQAKQGQVILPSGRVQSQSESVLDPRGNLTVRITVDNANALVELNRRQWWNGPHLLDPQKPRYIGVRFLRRDKGAGDGVMFSAIRVNMRQR